jgi:predicted nucleic acid-binding protein
MKILLDSNILTRLAQPTHPLHSTAQDSVRGLQGSGHTLLLVPQNLYEFWVVATRPVSANGLGFTGAEPETELVRLFGKNAHDARIVAAMVVHGLTHLLSFNLADFTRFPGIAVLDPTVVAAFSSP